MKDCSNVGGNDEALNKEEGTTTNQDCRCITIEFLSARSLAALKLKINAGEHNMLEFWFHLCSDTDRLTDVRTSEVKLHASILEIGFMGIPRTPSALSCRGKDLTIIHGRPFGVCPVRNALA